MFLYHLPEVFKAAEVVIVEGEKDADNLRALGFTATTSPGGAEKWQDRYSESLKSKRVVIMPDNDEAGKKHLAMVASSLSGAGIDPRVVIMPDGIKDVSDFIEMTSDPEQAAERIALMIEGAAPYVDETKPIGITASDLMCKSFPDVAWIVCGILSYGLWILAGKPKHGKSILAANIAIALSVAGTALGSIPVEFGRVVYLALEDTQRRLQRRLKQMVAFGGSASENLLFFTEWPRMDNGGLEELEDLIKRYHDIRLLIIDTWKLFRPPTKDSRGNLYDIDYETVSLVKKLADKYEICILLIHHFRKSESDDIFDTFSGSYGLTGAADGLLGLQRKSAGQADAILHVTGRDVEPAEYALKFIPEYLSWNLIGKADEVAATAEQQMIIEVLKNAKDTMTPKDIADGLEMKQQSVKNTLLKLKNRGLVSKEGYAKYKYIGTLSTVDTQSTVSTVSTVDSCKRTQRTF